MRQPVHQKCFRVYNTILFHIDQELYFHLQRENVEPPLHLMYIIYIYIYITYSRWFRCMLTREFHITDAIVFWDSIFAFIAPEHITLTTPESIYREENMKVISRDPLHFIDFLCAAMLLYLKRYCKLIYDT